MREHRSYGINGKCPNRLDVRRHFQEFLCRNQVRNCHGNSQPYFRTAQPLAPSLQPECFPEYETILSRNRLVQDPVPVARPISSLRFSSRFPCPSSSNLSTSGEN